MRTSVSAPHFPRVLAGTPAPPALREERIGKETAAGMFPPVCFLSRIQSGSSEGEADSSLVLGFGSGRFAMTEFLES